MPYQSRDTATAGSGEPGPVGPANSGRPYIAESGQDKEGSPRSALWISQDLIMTRSRPEQTMTSPGHPGPGPGRVRAQPGQDKTRASQTKRMPIGATSPSLSQPGPGSASPARVRTRPGHAIRQPGLVRPSHGEPGPAATIRDHGLCSPAKARARGLGRAGHYDGRARIQPGWRAG